MCEEQDVLKILDERRAMVDEQIARLKLLSDQAIARLWQERGGDGAPLGYDIESVWSEVRRRGLSNEADGGVE